METMNKVWSILFCAIFAVTIFLYALYPLANPNISCEDINFVDNDTWYQTANNPLVVVNNIYDDSDCTNAFPTDRWTYLTSNYSVKLYTNGTTGWPNITTGNHYVNYDYQQSSTIWGVDFGFIVILLVIVTGLFVGNSLLKHIH